MKVYETTEKRVLTYRVCVPDAVSEGDLDLDSDVLVVGEGFNRHLVSSVSDLDEQRITLVPDSDPCHADVWLNADGCQVDIGEATEKGNSD